MTVNIKILGSWKTIKSIHVKISGQWKTVQSGFIKILGQWKQFFSGDQTPQIEEPVLITGTLQSNYTYLLTGTNYHWTNYQTLTGYFEWSDDGGSTWYPIQTIESLVNPPSGSSNSTSIHVVLNVPEQISPNIDNLYRFRVYAVNGSQSFSSTSNLFTISTPRNVTNVTASQVGTDLQATVSFTPGLYTNSVKITRYKYSGATLQATQDFNRTTSSPATIPLDEYGKSYIFTVTPYSGSIVSSQVTGYNGNMSSMTTAFTANYPPAPVQLTKPTLNNTGSVSAGTTLLANSGSYALNTIADGDPNIAVQTRVYGWVSPGPSLVSGTTTVPSPDVTSATSQSYTITQLRINYVFYAVDIVLSADGLSTYYYYSDLSATSFLPSFSDNFNRSNTTGSQGLGQTSTGSWYWSTNGNLYGYQNPTTNTDGLSWQIDLNNAYNNNSVSFFAAPTDYQMKTINVGDSNVSLAVSIPNGGGGPGLAFWVTASGSWWAASPSYYSTTVTSSCATGCGYYSSPSSCGSCSYSTSTTTTYDCGGGPFSGASCPAGPYTPGPSTLGLRCSACSTNTQTLCLSGGNCIGEFCCPATGSGQGDRCGPCTLVKTCTGGPITSFTNTLGTGCNDKCSCTGPFTEPGTSSCTSSTTFVSTNPGPVYSCVTASDTGKVCESTFIGSGWLIKRCVAGTPSYTYYSCYTNVCANTYDINNISTVYTWNTVRSYDTTSYYCCPSSSTTTTYYTRIRILSANGSSVISQKEQILASSTTSYQPVRSIDLTTSGDSITVNGYSDTGRVIQLGSTVTHTASSPTKIVAGYSAVGIINTPTDANRTTGNRLDDFIYNNV